MVRACVEPTSELGFHAIEPTRSRDNIASMAWNRHAIAQTQLWKHVASMAWGARNLIPHGPRHELDVLRRRRVIDGRADGVRHAAGARVVGHFFCLCPSPPRLASRSGLVLRARPNLWAAGRALFSVQPIQGGESWNCAHLLLPYE